MTLQKLLCICSDFSWHNASFNGFTSYITSGSRKLRCDISLFKGGLTDDDTLVYVNNVLKDKLLESDLLLQVMNKTKEQFANMPDLAYEITGELAAQGAQAARVAHHQRCKATRHTASQTPPGRTAPAGTQTA